MSESPPLSRFRRFTKWLTTKSLGRDFFLHASLSSTLIFLVWSWTTVNKNFARDQADKWLELYNGKVKADEDVVQPSTSSVERVASDVMSAMDAAPVQEQTISAPKPPKQAAPDQTESKSDEEIILPPTDKEQQRLNEQLASIRARTSHHGTVMAFFYRAYYVAISGIMLAGLIAAVALFFIAQKGWGPTHALVKNVFLVMTAATAYFGLFPSVFQQQQNISDNKILFLAYKGLENEVVSYPETQANIQGESKTASEYITYVDSEMSRLGNIAIGFDYSKVSYKDAFDLSDKRVESDDRNDPNRGTSPNRRP